MGLLTISYAIGNFVAWNVNGFPRKWMPWKPKPHWLKMHSHERTENWTYSPSYLRIPRKPGMGKHLSTLQLGVEPWTWNLKPGTKKALSPHAFTLLYPFYANVTCNYPHHWHITPTSPCDALMMLCSFDGKPTCMCPNVWAEILTSEHVHLCIHAQPTSMESEILTQDTHCDTHTLAWKMGMGAGTSGNIEDT